MDREKQDFLQTTGCVSITKPFDLKDVRRAVLRVFTHSA